MRFIVAKTLISIHVPREGDDLHGAQGDAQALSISIHVPREGDDRKIHCVDQIR